MLTPYVASPARPRDEFSCCPSRFSAPAVASPRTCFPRPAFKAATNAATFAWPTGARRLRRARQTARRWHAARPYDTDRASARRAMPLAHLGLRCRCGRCTGGDGAGRALLEGRPPVLAGRLRHSAARCPLSRPGTKHSWRLRDARAALLSGARAGSGQGALVPLSTQEQAAWRAWAAPRPGPGPRFDRLLVEGGSRSIGPDASPLARYGSAAPAAGVRLLRGRGPALQPAGRCRHPAAAPRPTPASTASSAAVTKHHASRGRHGRARGRALVVRVTLTADASARALLTELLPAGGGLTLTGRRSTWADLGWPESSSANAASAAELLPRIPRYPTWPAELEAGARPTWSTGAAVTPASTRCRRRGRDMYRPELRGVGRAEPARITVVQP